MPCHIPSSIAVISSLVALISAGCAVSAGAEDRAGAGAERLERAADANLEVVDIRACRECTCGDGGEAPIGTPCGGDGLGSCRSGLCLYWCGGADGDCGVNGRFVLEAVDCRDPCGKYGVCPTPEEPAACPESEQ